jgi:hypothetical protein
MTKELPAAASLSRCCELLGLMASNAQNASFEIFLLFLLEKAWQPS